MGKASDICLMGWAVADDKYGPTGYRTGDGYEYNVGLWTGSLWSFDCLGFVHTMVNGFKGDRSVLGGGAVMDDFVLNSDEPTTLYNYCSNRGSFPKADLKPGSLLEMHNTDGHVGMFTGMINGYQNMVECTGGGVRHAYIDENGDVWNTCAKEYFYEHFENWGEFDRVTYDLSASEIPGKVTPTPTPEPTPTPTTKEPTYMTYDDVDKKWLPEVYGDNDYAGVFGHDVDCVAVKGAKYQVHCWAGDGTEKYDFADWLEPVDGFDINNYENGFAGNYHPIDAFIVYGEGYEYKVHLRGGDWLETVKSENANTADSENGYAGIIGKPIDAIMIWKK